jgi:hypothetical protein
MEKHRNVKYQEVVDHLNISLRTFRAIWKDMPHTYLGVRQPGKMLTLRMARFNLDEVTDWWMRNQAQS